jgi:hypothetical protein
MVAQRDRGAANRVVDLLGRAGGGVLGHAHGARPDIGAVAARAGLATQALRGAPRAVRPGKNNNNPDGLRDALDRAPSPPCGTARFF